MKFSCKLKQSVRVTLLVCLLSPAIGFSATNDELEQRVQRLEDATQVIHEEASDSTNRLNKAFALSGYADIEYVGTDKANANSGFRIHHLSIMYKKQVREDLKFFAETEYEDAPYVSAAPAVSSGKILVEAVNFDYTINNNTSARVGRFFTPAGIWSVDHYPPFVSTQDRPMHIRQIFPQVTDGASVSGNHAIGDSFVDYNAFVGNGESFLAGNPSFNGTTDQNSSSAFGLKVGVALPIAKQFYVGGTVYHEKLTTVDQAMKNAYGIHAKIKYDNFGFQGEYANGSYNPTVGATLGQVYHRKGYYGQFSYDIDKWTLGYRYDYFDPTSVIALDNTKINTLIVNYHVDKNAVLKWEHHLVNLENPIAQDYYRSIASVVVNFD